jgi:2-keto-4-pentenoate hydratase
VSEAAAAPAGRELFTRVARKDGRSVALMRAIDYGVECVVETEVYLPNAVTALRAGPYTFADARQATAFVTEAVEALMYLGCDIQAA